MNKTIQIDNQTFNFLYSDTAKCFSATQSVNEIMVDFEIYEEEYNQEEIHWDYFSEFVRNIRKHNNLPNLIEKSQRLLIDLAETIGGIISEHQNIEDYHMVFSGLQFKGSTGSTFRKGLFEFSLWFTIQKKSVDYSYVDPYGYYITDIEGRFIMGARRRQC